MRWELSLFFFIAWDNTWNVLSAIFLSVLPCCTKVWPVYTTMTGEVSCQSKVLCYDFASKQSVFRPMEGSLHWRLIEFPLLLVLLGRVVQKRGLLLFQENGVDVSKHSTVFSLQKVVMLEGVSVALVLGRLWVFSEMLLWQFQMLLGKINKEQNPCSK